MNIHQILVEKIKNPLRKSFLRKQNIESLFPTLGEKILTKIAWISMIMNDPLETLPDHYQDIKLNWMKNARVSIEQGRNYLEDQWEEYVAEIGQPKIEKAHYEKVYEYQGVQVFVDRRYIKDDYSVNSYNWRMIKNSVNNLLIYIRDILPNRKPRIVITDLTKNPMTRSVENVEQSAGIYYKKIILIDQYRIDNPKYFIHEYAHWVADRIPKQTELMLANAYEKLLKIYFSKIRKKRLSGEQMDDTMREKISRKLGFPSGYGLLNEHEMFAVLIEHWKTIPNNPMTYKFKTMVKNVLTRL